MSRIGNNVAKLPSVALHAEGGSSIVVGAPPNRSFRVPFALPAHLLAQQGLPKATLFAPSTTDPFLWLEEVEGAKAMEWVEAQNKKSLGRLESDPRFAEFRSTAEAILQDKERIPLGTRQGNYIYNFWQDEEHVQGIWRRTTVDSYDSPAPQWETVLDLDQLSKVEGENWVLKRTVCLPPEFNRCLVYLSRGGKDAIVVREFDLEKKQFVKDGFQLPEAKSRFAWVDENTVLVGTDFGPGSMTTSSYPRIVKRWKRGTPLEKAQPIFAGKTEDVSVWGWHNFRPGDRHILIQRYVSRYDIKASLLSPAGQTIPIQIPTKVSIESFFEGHLLVHLKESWQPDPKQAAFRKNSLIAILVADILAKKTPYRAGSVYEPDSRTTISGVITTKDGVFLNLATNVKGRLVKVGQKKGEGKVEWKTEEMPTPANMTISTRNPYDEFFIGYDDFYNDIYFTAENFLTPTRLVRWDTQTGTQSTIRSLQEKFASDNLTVVQYEATSPDGTKVPYFAIHKKDLKRDGKNPTLLYGYGGFEVSMMPLYYGHLGKLWLEKGGIYVLANIRGGGEFGPAWHQAALKENRQKAFDDFVAVAEDLIDRNISTPQKLGIMGGSNGGLLMGVSFTQRPDLFTAVVCQVPILDMLRYSKLLAGASWRGEYGDPDDPKMRAVLQRYSPYHNVRAGVRYPEVFFDTSTKDDRVHPGHARKMVARMQAEGQPVLYFENIEGGHSAAANLKQRARRIALEFVYLHQKLFDPPGK